MSYIMDKFEDKINNGENVLITVVGDSITYGLYGAGISDTYCAVLSQRLGFRFPDTKVVRYDGKMSEGSKPLDGYEKPVVVSEGEKGKITVVKCGVGGDTVRRALNRKEDYIGAFSETGEMPDVFLLMFGINDSLKSDASKFIEPEGFKENLRELTKLLNTENPGADLVFMTPTCGGDGLSKNDSVDPYADAMKEHAEETGYMLIDTHKLWMDHLEIGAEHCGQKEWLNHDPWHYTAAGGIATGNFIFEELNK